MSIYNVDVTSFLYSIKMLNNYQWLLFLNPYILRITPFCFVGGSDFIYVICIALHFWWRVQLVKQELLFFA
jgi:hypothetical protein